MKVFILILRTGLSWRAAGRDFFDQFTFVEQDRAVCHGFTKSCKGNAHVRNRMNMNETGESRSTVSLRQFESLSHFGGRLSIGFAKQMVNVWMQDDTHGAQRYLTKEQAFKNHVAG